MFYLKNKILKGTKNNYLCSYKEEMMNDWLIYLLKVNMVMTVLYLCYQPVRNHPNLKMRRGCLWLCLVLSFILPLIHRYFTIAFTNIPASVLPMGLAHFTTLQNTYRQLESEQNVKIFSLVIQGIYAVVLGVLLAKFLIAIVLEWRKTRSAKTFEMAGKGLKILKGSGGPFCFGRRIYIFEDTLQEAGLNLMIQHEQAHVDGLHTLDILVFEFTKIVCWFNPFAWLQTKAMRYLLECTADRKAVETTSEKSAYLTLLLKKLTKEVNPVCSSFYGRNQWMRMSFLLMDQNEKKKRFLLFLLAAVMILFFGICQKRIAGGCDLFSPSTYIMKSHTMSESRLIMKGYSKSSSFVLTKWNKKLPSYFLDKLQDDSNANIDMKDFKLPVWQEDKIPAVSYFNERTSDCYVVKMIRNCSNNNDVFTINITQFQRIKNSRSWAQCGEKYYILKIR